MPRSTGDETFDAMLDGGVPAGRTVLLRGGPGTGTRRLATGFLAAGEDADALYVTADSPAPSLRSGDATVATLSDADDGIALSVAGDTPETTDLPSLPGALGEGYDRVVVDGADGVAALAADDRFLPRLLSRFEEAGAACLVTTADEAPRLSRRAAGVVECWQEPVDGDYQAFVRVRKLDGVDHDTRRHRLALSGSTASVVPRESPQPSAKLRTGIEAFDDLAGGFVRGGTTVFEHDGTADHWPFTAATCARVIENGAAVVLITAPGTVSGQVNDMLEPRLGSVQELMAKDALYVVDTVSHDRETTAMSGFPAENVIVQSEAGSLQESIRALVERLSGQPVLAVLEVTPVLHLVDGDQARQLFYWASANVLALDGLSLVLSVDRAVAGDELAAFFASSAEQVFRTWQGDEGIQYLSVRKSPDGSPGHSRAVEPLSEPPFVRLR